MVGKKPKPGNAPTVIVTTPATYEGTTHAGTTEDRQRVYGSNVLPVRKSKSLFELMWLVLKDRVLILLFIAVITSLVLGFFQDFSQPGTPSVSWIEGAAIIVAILIVVMVGSLNDWQKERKLRILDEKKERCVKVVRSGTEHVIDVKELVVGDIAFLEPDQIVPCDGVFISGHNVRCDESGATGESAAIKKVGYDEWLWLRERAKREGAGTRGFNVSNTCTNCFVVSGSKVLDGHGKYVVIAVGEKSFNGRAVMALRGDPAPLQEKLKDLKELAKIGGSTGLAVCAALTIRSLMQPSTGEPEGTSSGNGFPFLRIFIIPATLIAFTVPEGLPFAMTLALAFAAKRMGAENILIRTPGSCETLANASVVCTDKTGTLTRNDTRVVVGSIGIHTTFVHKENEAHTNVPDQGQDQTRRQDMMGVASDFSIEQSDINTILSPQLKRLLNQSIVISCTALRDIGPETNELTSTGSKTEIALLQFAKELGWEETRGSAEIIQTIPVSGEPKATGVVVRLQSGRYRLLLKGASEILVKRCTCHVVVSKNPDQSQQADSEIETQAIDDITKDSISQTIISHANQIALCYRDFESWPPAGAHFRSADEISYEDLSRDMTLMAIVGVDEPLRPGVRDAVTACHCAGVTVKMCTGDDVPTARSVATQCGIYTPGGTIMEGPAFRALDARERMEVVPRLQVLARSSPEDKKVLVETLRSLGEIVGVTGDGADDVPALKAANVGFSMGIASTEVAKEASDIVLMDENFSSIIKTIMWGRWVNDAVCKFSQFQTSINIATLITTFLFTLAPTEEILTITQLLWIHIVVTTFAAFALIADPPSKFLLDRKPDTRRTRLLTADMAKMILGQSIYQVTVLLVFHFLGHRILGLDRTDEGNGIVATVMFNTFVFAQIFNSVNCRRVDNKLNIFEGIIKSRYFVAITIAEIAVQVLIVFFGGGVFQVTRIHGREWAISVGLGFVSIPLGVLIRCVPTPPLERVFVKLRIGSEDEILPTVRPDASDNVSDSRSLFFNLLGGLLSGSSFTPEDDLIALSTVVTSSVGTGSTVTIHHDQSQSSAAVGKGNTLLHPDTKPTNPAH